MYPLITTDMDKGLLHGGNRDAALVFPPLVTSSEPARTEEAFLLQASVGDDNTCVPASGPWPTDGFSFIQSGSFGHPYITCYSTKPNSGYAQQQCWSKTYNAGGLFFHWKPCTPKGYGSVWVFEKTPTPAVTPCMTFA